MVLEHVLKKMALSQLHQFCLLPHNGVDVHLHHVVFPGCAGFVFHNKGMNDNMMLLPKVVLQHYVVDLICRICLVPYSLDAHRYGLKLCPMNPQAEYTWPVVAS